ncbi:DUF6777 domain-containing protein [Streptomyces platensis]|uniref:DUF6777 domain-containing protein n=1 Tax=Streptomyces platensis TaxID=58346 RepID=UPI003C2AFACD
MKPPLMPDPYPRGSPPGPLPRSPAGPSPEVPPPEGGSTDPHRRGRRRVLLVVGLASFAMAIGLFFLGRQAEEAQRQEAVRLQPAAAVAPDPFTPSVAGPVPALRAVPTPPAPSPEPGKVRVAGHYGSEPGLFGGTGKTSACDTRRLANLLLRDPHKSRVWAEALGRTPADLRRYLTELTPVVVIMDTRVPDHHYREGRARPYQAVLQAGTAVLLDRYGVPRVSCSSGDPLRPPAAVTTKVAYTGQSWRGFRADGTVRVLPSRRPLRALVLTDVATGERFIRPVGAAGTTDRNGAGTYGSSAPRGTVAAVTVTAVGPPVTGLPLSVLAGKARRAAEAPCTSCGNGRPEREEPP